MSDLLQIHKALADETRLRLLRLLSRSPLNVNEVIDILRMGQSRISRHLRILAEAGLVTRRREGTWIYYERSPDPQDKLVADVLHLGSDHERALPHFEADMQRMEAAIERRRQQTRSFFDSRRDGDELRHQSLDGAHYRQVALSLLPEHCDTILDLGTGSGLLLPALLARADKVIAVDASATMLELARASAGADGDRCEFRLGDLEHLPVRDGEADAVMACMVLHHVSTPSVALAEAWRALGDGGNLAIVDLARHEDESLRELADLWLGFQPAEMRRWLKMSGFEVQHADTVAPGIATNNDTDIQLITFTGRKPWQPAQSKSPRRERKRTASRATAAARSARTTTK
ncbi:MAG: metalloregulator ArsR/SmtB family transcription factor [bacterium]|nr:metalloregulator ArsR/SmtB family transcription factor [bacterium]